MDAFECVATKLDIREFSSKEVPREIKIKGARGCEINRNGS